MEIISDVKLTEVNNFIVTISGTQYVTARCAFVASCEEAEIKITQHNKKLLKKKIHLYEVLILYCLLCFTLSSEHGAKIINADVGYSSVFNFIFFSSSLPSIIAILFS
jgi:hypothetical protein